MHNFCDTHATSVKRAQLLGNVHSTKSLKRAHIEYLKRLCGGGETHIITHMCIYSVHVCIGYIYIYIVYPLYIYIYYIHCNYTLRFQKDPKEHSFWVGTSSTYRCFLLASQVSDSKFRRHSSAEAETQTEPLIS